MEPGNNNDVAIIFMCAVVLALVFALVCMGTDKFIRWMARRRANRALRMIAWPKQ